MSKQKMKDVRSRDLVVGAVRLEQRAKYGYCCDNTGQTRTVGQ